MIMEITCSNVSLSPKIHSVSVLQTSPSVFVPGRVWGASSGPLCQHGFSSFQSHEGQSLLLVGLDESLLRSVKVSKSVGGISR